MRGAQRSLGSHRFPRPSPWPRPARTHSIVFSSFPYSNSPQTHVIFKSYTGGQFGSILQSSSSRSWEGHLDFPVFRFVSRRLFASDPSPSSPSTFSNERPSFLESLLLWLKITAISVRLLGPLLMNPLYYRNQKSANEQYDIWTDEIRRILNVEVTYVDRAGLSSISSPVLYVWLNQRSVFDSVVFTRGISQRDRSCFFICNPLFLSIPLLGIDLLSFHNFTPVTQHLLFLAPSCHPISPPLHQKSK